MQKGTSQHIIDKAHYHGDISCSFDKVFVAKAHYHGDLSCPFDKVFEAGKSGRKMFLKMIPNDSKRSRNVLRMIPELSRNCSKLIMECFQNRHETFGWLAWWVVSVGGPWLFEVRGGWHLCVEVRFGNFWRMALPPGKQEKTDTQFCQWFNIFLVAKIFII